MWVTDRGIPTEAVLSEMRATDPPVCYLVGTPKRGLSQDDELYVVAHSHDQVAKERLMRKR